MILTEKGNELPVVLRTDDVQDCSLEDLRDLFLDFSVDSVLGGSLLYGDHPVLGDRNSFGGSDSFTDDAPGADDW